MKKSFKDSLNLPTTDFSIRANAVTKEPEIRAFWDSHQVDMKAQERNKKEAPFFLHDGPPYANGHIHIGTAFNKILKDIICKYHRMTGKHVYFKPGWDCHGLPIELKVIEQAGDCKGTGSEKKITFKKQCRAFAQSWIDTQKDEFRNLGVFADWDDYYATMTPTYQAAIVRAFASFVEQGYIERKGKTVPWCLSCKTVLAQAEIEYHDRVDPSVYVLFPLTHDAEKKIQNLLPNSQNIPLSLLVWTTTPWTLPLNRAVMIKPNTEYAVVIDAERKRGFIVAQSLVERLCKKFDITPATSTVFSSSELASCSVHHPFLSRTVPIIMNEGVSIDEGTACVHVAPGCGPEDYFIGLEHKLEIFSPLSPEGKYTEGIEPKELQGISVREGQQWVIKMLRDEDKLLCEEKITHSYPHCWRCRNGLIFRATDQWFCNLEKNNLVLSAAEAIESTNFVPSWGKKRLLSSVSQRKEWCISRQRQWGCPIISLLCTNCDTPYLNTSFINTIVTSIESYGIEYWDRVTLAELKQQGSISNDITCASCGHREFKKEEDILDVWFDSGVSHFAVSYDEHNFSFPADVYLEGSDQHRGWFQSSLLTSLVLADSAPMKTIVTHGYVVDEKGHKMSKSRGNVIAPHEVIKKYSTDILRLWVAMTDFEGDMVISDTLLNNGTEVYKKIRNTCRFMLANLFDFDPHRDALPHEKLSYIDRYALLKLADANEKILKAYESYAFTTVASLFAHYCTVDLSSLYFDMIKDRLYVEAKQGRLRRSAQTVLYVILDTITRLMAPILSFLSEEVFEHYKQKSSLSIHLEDFAHVSLDQISNDDQETWKTMIKMREGVLKAIERQREKGIIKHSLEAKVTIYINKNDENGERITSFLHNLEQHEDTIRFLKDWFIVSQVERAVEQGDLCATPLPWLFVTADHAQGTKCPRCWQWDAAPGEDGLCQRCIDVLKGQVPLDKIR